MIAARIREWGALPVIEDVSAPTPAADEVLLKIRAASLNPVDLFITSGRFYGPVPDPPLTAGAECVAEVVEDGGGFSAGSRVWNLSVHGGLAEYTTAAADRLVPVPDGLSDEMAAAIGIAGLAGWMSVLHRGRVADDDTVVVLGASGVVGQVAVQAATHQAARVVAAARSDEGLARARSLGADAEARIGDGFADALATAAPDGVDLIIDTVWGSAAPVAIAQLNPRGRLIQVGNAEAPESTLVGGPLRGRRVDIRGFSVYSEYFVDVASAYAELAAEVLAERIVLDVRTFTLEDAPKAWAEQKAGLSGDKLVVIPPA